MSRIRKVVEGVVLTAAVAGATVAGGFAGVGSSAGLAAVVITSASAASGGALGNLTYAEFCAGSDRIVEYLLRSSGSGELPINHDIARAVRRAQIMATEAIAALVVDELRPMEADRSAQIAYRPLGEFLTEIRKWRQVEEESLRSNWLTLAERDDLQAAGRRFRELLGSLPTATNDAAAEKFWVEAGKLVIDELSNFGIPNGPPIFFEAVTGRSSIRGIRWSDAVVAFFAQQLKKDTAVYRAVSIDLLHGLGRDVSRLEEQFADQGKALLTALQASLGPIGDRLASIENALGQFAANDAHIEAKLECILVLLVALSETAVSQRLSRWSASEYADSSVAAVDVRRLIDENSGFFVGRQADLNRLDEFVAGNDRGLITVAAPAGFGKSALLAHWLRRRQQVGDFVARHVIARRQPETIPTDVVLDHVLQQLRAYRGPEFVSAGARPQDAIAVCLRDGAYPDERLIVLIDGLDEANEALPGFVRQAMMGAGVYVVLGIRAEPKVTPDILRPWLSGIDGIPTLRLDLSPMPMPDIVLWLRAAVPYMRFIDEAEIVAALERTTGGLPLFLRFLVEDFAARSQSAGVAAARRALLELPSSFTEYIRERMAELDQLEAAQNPAWSYGSRRLFAILTQTLGPISARELHAGGLVPKELNLRKLHHLAERWFSISGPLMDRSFAFAHPRLASIFGKVLGYEADEARAALIAHCERWQDHCGAYALTFLPGHLLALAAEDSWSKASIERAAATLCCLAFHQRRLALPLTDDMMVQAARQLRILAEKANAIL
jgi:hypothetical protein